MVSQPCSTSFFLLRCPSHSLTKLNLSVNLPRSRAGRFQVLGLNAKCEFAGCAGFQNRFQQWVVKCGAVGKEAWDGTESINDAGGSDEESEGKVVLGKIARRTLLVSFKCDRCEARTDRMVNPNAWEKGTVFVQCSGCEVWHKLKDNMNLIDEIRYADEVEE